MESEQRGRTSRASSTSSLGREVRCGCQYYQSDSLLPERRALLVRPSSRTMQQPPAVRCSEHDYEPIAPPSLLSHPPMAPVVRITDTDVMPVADSDDSIDDRGRLPPELILDGGVILPLDGKIEDSAMEGRELGETGGDTSAEELEPTAQQFQDRLEERFLSPTPHTESRTDGEVNISQVDSSAVEELAHQRGARGLPQRLKTQAGKLRSRLRDFQRPTFSFPQKRQKPEKTTKTTKTTTTTARSATASSGKSDKSRKSVEKRPSRIDRIRTSISEKTGKFSLPDRPKFSLPDRSKFHLPERPKFTFPDKSRFHLPDKSKFTIKKPNIRLPEAFTRVKRAPPLREQQQQHSTESTAGSKRNIFDFATYPRIFDKKSKKRGEYATSSPKDSRGQSAESATFPRARKGKSFSARWAERFGDSAYVRGQNRPEEVTGSDGSPPWHQSSMEEPPRLSARTEEEIMAAARAIPWEDTRKRDQYDEEEIQYMDYEQESSEMSERHPAPPKRSYKSRRREESYERERAIEVDPKLYDEEIKHVHRDDVEENEDAAMQDEWHADQQIIHKEKFRSILKSRSLDEDMPRVLEQGRYDGAFIAVDPRLFGPRKVPSDEEEGEEEQEPSSMQSDREQQASSGSSYDRRRRGVIEEIDSDEFFLRASGISQDDMNLGNYLTDEIRDALRSEVIKALQGDELPPTPPQRPKRSRTSRKQKEGPMETDETVPPVRPKRERSTTSRQSREASIEMFRERTRSDSRSDSRHRVVYQAEGDQSNLPQEPLDDIVVVKPVRRKSRSSLRSHSQPPMETSILFSSTPVTAVPDSSTILTIIPPIVPVRRKRSHRVRDRINGDVGAPICNGHRDDWEIEIVESKKPVIPAKASRSRQSLVEFADGDVVMSTSREDIENLDARLRQENAAPEPPMPVPPKRRSRSRATSVLDEDRTSHGAESLPEAGYVEEDIPREEENGSARDLSGYAIVEKREKLPRPLVPRRKRNKFATTPRPAPPKRPQRAYSTLGPTRTKDISVRSETIIGTTLASSESIPYIEVEEDDVEHRDLRSGEFLDKIQGRPLPAPPRPPRARKEHAITERPRTPFEYEATEATTATQTDPLPDDMIIEEITQAKLIMTPSRSGSQIMVSMERIPSPNVTPPVPPLPMSQFLRKEEEEEEEEEEQLPGKEDIRIAYDTMSLTSLSPTREIDLKDKHRSAPHLEERIITEDSQSRPQVKPALLSDEPLRISSLEVGDLKVDRLSVSQIEAHKIVASEVDAMMITASELRGGDSMEESFSPAIIRELMAIRSHLETVMTTQVQEKHRESEKEFTSHKITDIPIMDDNQIQERQPPSQDVPLEQQPVSQNILLEQQPVSQDVLLEQQPISQDVPSKQQLVSQDVLLEQQPVSQDVPSEQEPISQDVPSEQEPISQDVPSKQQPVSQDIPLEQEPVSQDVPSKQQPVSQDVSLETTTLSESIVNEPASTEDEKTEASEDQKIPNIP
ncbi:serine/arginine repetitive matrix protein 2 isoform X2 [Monomorium pharaonis]|uniref:serine/arginine repetitive matrix protein 2 isoform X2 n=1 Tax=Monomorium pharaonis TaxID=307658 RepID=UPI00063F0280|nr:serine/arginine repetitive matrix protein 2 isoform X2 [Monomorium pharaonis]